MLTALASVIHERQGAHGQKRGLHFQNVVGHAMPVVCGCEKRGRSNAATGPAVTHLEIIPDK
jgi:hypothetical protein